MDNIKLIITFAVPLFGMLSATIGLIIKVIIAVKQGNLQKVQNALEEAAKEAVAFVEDLKSKTGDDLAGETKKQIALVRINEALIEKGLKFDVVKAGEVVEELVRLTKQVNVKNYKSSALK